MEKDYLININATILDALKSLNQQYGIIKTLVVVDDEGCAIGTITDGDIRRALISGKQLSDKVLKFVNKDFKYIKLGELDSVQRIHELKSDNIKLIPVLDDAMHIVEIIDLMKYSSCLPIDAVLMAGGKGVRLRPLTDKIPKPLLCVGDKPIIDYNIESLINYGIKHVSVTVNYLKEQLVEHFTNPINNIKIDTVSEPKFLGTIGATQFVPKFYNDVVLVMNSDLFTNIDLEDFYLHFKQNNADLSVASVPYSISVPYGIFDLDGSTIYGIREKPVYNYSANAGIYLIRKELLENMPKDIFYNATDLIKDSIKTSKKVISYPITGYWLDIGNHEEYAKANELVKHIKRN